MSDDGKKFVPTRAGNINRLNFEPVEYRFIPAKGMWEFSARRLSKLLVRLLSVVVHIPL